MMCLFLLFSILSYAEEKSALLDVHLHYWPEHDGFMEIEKEKCTPTVYDVIDGVEFFTSCSDGTDEKYDQTTYKEFLNSKNVKFAFLISPSFHISKSDTPTIPERMWSQDETNIPKMDARISELVQSHPDRLIGFCGMNYSWQTEESIARVNSCLQLPGMKGIKMHSYTADDKHQLKDSQESVDKVLASVENKKPFILWHIKPCGEDYKNCDLNEVNFVYEMAKRYPHILFIIAHSMYEPEAVQLLIDREKQDGVRLSNLFLETSEGDPKKMKQAWDDFGLDRLLFGSDNFNVNDHAFNKLNKESNFSEEELELIKNLNPKKLLEHGDASINDDERGNGKADLEMSSPEKKHIEASKM